MEIETSYSFQSHRWLGDNWQFDVTLEQVDPERSTETSIVLESHGKAPEQYPGWGDWE